MKSRLKRRPAESFGLAGAVALLICRAAGINDPDILVAIGTVIAALPACVTWTVATIRGREDGFTLLEAIVVLLVVVVVAMLAGLLH